MKYLTDLYRSQDLPSTLLLISDDPMNAAFLDDFFSYHGTRVHCYESVSALPDQLTVHFEFGLVDLVQHQMDSQLEQLKKRFSQMPTLVLANHFDALSMMRCFQNEVSDYLVKPINIDLLALKISRINTASILVKQSDRQRDQLEQLVYQQRSNQAIAHNVYNSMIDSFSESLEVCQSIKMAAEEFSGDICLTGEAPNGNIFVLLGDATGHGLAAAIQILPIANIFRTMVSKGCELSLMVVELNRRLRESGLVDRFVACCLAELDVLSGKIRVWNGGMPDAVLYDHDGGELYRFASRHMALGALDDNLFSVEQETFKLSGVSRLVMMTDGIIEQRNQQGEWFGQQRALKLLAQPSTDRVELINQELEAFMGHTRHDDDITIAEVSVAALHNKQRGIRADPQDNQTGRLTTKIELTGQMLADTGLLTVFNQLLKNVSLPVSTRQRAYTVFTELYNNALDHGIMKLPSHLKDDPSGFVVYLEEREKRKQQLKSDDCIEIAIVLDESCRRLKISVKDTGSGYEEAKMGEKLVPFGRGLMLIHRLSQEVEIAPPGNQTSVTVKWEDHE